MEIDVPDNTREDEESQTQNSMTKILDALEESYRKYPTNEALDTAIKNGEIPSMVGFQFPRKDAPERE